MKNLLASFLLLTPLVFTSFDNKAQETPRPCSYFFNVNGGTLISGNTANFTISTTHGVTIGKNLRVGAGIGYVDYGNVTTIPIFTNISYDVIHFKNGNAVFAAANYGWASASFQHKPYYYAFTETVSGGQTFSPHIGYRIKCNQFNLSITVGSSTQQIKTTFTDKPLVIDPVFAPKPSNENKNLNRLMFTVSVGWK
jgi:hypothetical protein